MNEADVAFPHLGIYFSHLPKSIQIGSSFDIAYYGIILTLGMLAGLCLARWQAKRTGQDPDMYLDYVVLDVIFAVLGARLYYVIFRWDVYRTAPMRIFNIREGGLAIYGAVIVSVLMAVIFCRRRKYKFWLFADTAVLGLILGQIIGRYGNFMNREAFGEYTDSFFAMRLKVGDVVSSNITPAMQEHMQTIGGEQFIQVHPTFLYESMWNFFLLIIMLWYAGRKKFDGEVFLLYLVGYGIGRCWIEGLRTDQLQIGSTGIAVSQLLSACLVAAGIGYWVYCRVKYRKQKRDVKTDARKENAGN